MQKKTVMVIEDNRSKLRKIRKTLENCNWQILEPIDIDARIPMLQKDLPDLILVDSQHPGRDWLKIIKKIRKDPALKDVPIFAINDTKQDEIGKYYSGGRDTGIAWQINSHRILETLNRFFSSTNKHEEKDQLNHKILRMHAQYYVSIFLINNPI